MSEKIRESDYYPLLEKWLVNRYLNCYDKYNSKTSFILKVRDENLVEFDIVGGYKWDNNKRFSTYSIELKIDNASDKLFDQVKIRQKYCDHCWIAHSLGNSSNFFYHVLKEKEYLIDNGIGVLLVDLTTNRVFQVLETRISKNKNVLPLLKRALVVKLGITQFHFTKNVETEQIILE